MCHRAEARQEGIVNTMLNGRAHSAYAGNGNLTGPRTRGAVCTMGIMKVVKKRFDWGEFENNGGAIILLSLLHRG